MPGKFYKTKITATVISSEPIRGDTPDALCVAIEDDNSVICEPIVVEEVEITPVEAAKFMDENSKDPGWFGLAPDGTPIDDEFEP